MRRPRIAAAALAGMLALSLTSCGDDLQGEVTSKQVKPGYTYIYMMPIYSTRCSGKPHHLLHTHPEKD